MRPQPNRWVILAVLCTAVFTILVDTNIVNVALPTLVRELDASNRDLLWIVDAYNLLFAAFVLAAGSLSDRYGRKRALIAGLAVFGAATTVGAFMGEASQLIVARGVMGIGAAIIFPTTLSILTNVFTDRAERAKAIGIWGGTTGIAIAASPIVGGALLEHFWWGSVFLAMTPVAIVAIVLVARVVPESRDPSTPRLDVAGLALSTIALGTLVFTIIEAPDAGWTAPRTFAGFALAAGIVAAFIAWERTRREPMLDVTLFRNPRFTAASGSVTVAFFALFGFIFLITQYFQFLRGYSPLQTGLRVVPVALAVGAASVGGAQLAVRLGNKLVVATGLTLLSVGFLWISTVSTSTAYLEIVGQMLVVGTGMGFTAAPATEAIMGVVPADKAGVGSAVNDATRELGGTLGVAVIGSVFTSIYTASLDDAPIADALPAEALERARHGVGAAQLVAEQLAERAGPMAAQALRAAASEGYYEGFAIGCLVAAGVAAAGVVLAARYLPARPDLPADPDDAISVFEGPAPDLVEAPQS